MTEILAAAEDDPQRLSFLRSLALAALRLNGQKITPDFVTTLRADIRPGIAFLKGIGVPTTAYQNLIQAVGHGGDISEEAKDFRIVFYNIYKDKFKTRVNIFNAAHQAFLDKVLAYFNRKSDNAFNETRNAVSGLKDAALNKLFAFESTKTKAVDTQTLFETMRQARKVGRKQLPLIEPPLLMAAFKSSHPDEYAQWYDAYKSLRNVFRDRVKVFVRTHADANGLVLLSKLRSHFESSDEEDFDWFLPVNLDKLAVDENNRLHAADGTPVVTGVGGPVEPIPATPYTPNASYKTSTKANPAFMHYPNAMGTGDTPIYLANNRKESKAAADAAISEIMEKWPTIEPKLLRDLSSQDYNKRVAATILEIIYQMAARIGGDGLTKVKDAAGTITEQPTYGISSILKKHVKAQGNRLIISYPGKKHVLQEHILDPSGNTAMARVIENIKEFMGVKRASDSVFTINDGKRIAGTAVNAYLRSFGFKEPKVSAHKLRHVKGDSIVKPLFDEYRSPSKMTAETLKKAFIEIMTEAGRKLGHKSGENVTWTTASKSYVSPGLQKAFFTSRDFLPPKQVAQLSSTDD